MASLLKLERDRLAAELDSVRRLIQELDEEDVMARMGLEDRAEELSDDLARLDAHEDRNASLALFFGGKPVLGQRGIESDFAGLAVAKFQDLVSKIMAEELVGLGERGPVPVRHSSTMHITNIVRGSFGFLLEEMNTQGQLVDTALENAVQKAGRLLIAFTSEDVNEFEEAVGDTDSRVVNSVRDIFQLLENNDATFRYVTHQIDHAFPSQSVDLALDRALNTDLEEEVVGLLGIFLGFLPEGHMFEFRTDDRTIRGRVSRDIEAGQIVRWNREVLGREVHARFNQTSVLKDGEVARQSFKLLGIGGQLQIEADEG